MLGMVTTSDASTTGVKEIANALGGGIREGSLVIIEGDSKSGKSVLSQHITHGVLCSRETSVAYYTMDDTIEEIINNMDSLSISVRHDLVTDRLRVYTIDAGKVIQNPANYLQELVNHISQLALRFKLVIVDSVTALMSHAGPAIKMDFLQICKELCGKDRSIVLSLDTHVFEAKMLHRVQDMSDYYLRLRSEDMMIATGQIDTRQIKMLEVTKLAGAERRETEPIKFEIKPRVGIQILPFVKVKI